MITVVSVQSLWSLIDVTRPVKGILFGNTEATVVIDMVIGEHSAEIRDTEATVAMIW